MIKAFICVNQRHSLNSSDIAEYDETSGTDEEHCIVMENAGQFRVLECSLAERNFACQMPKGNCIDQYVWVYGMGTCKHRVGWPT